jgi:two-component system, cell cycle sensor histidine kinase and response regulator CckA
MKKKAAKAKSAKAKTAKAKPAKVKRTKELILIVDDENSVRVALRDGLAKHGYEVLEAADGWEALQVLRASKRQPDLMVTDLMMPSLSGRELLDALGSGSGTPKILVMSGHAESDLPARSLPLAPYQFIKKPFTPQELVTKVRAMLGTV